MTLILMALARWANKAEQGKIPASSQNLPASLVFLSPASLLSVDMSKRHPVLTRVMHVSVGQFQATPGSPKIGNLKLYPR